MLLAPDSSGVIAVQPVRSVAPSAAVVVDADAMMCGGLLVPAYKYGTLVQVAKTPVTADRFSHTRTHFTISSAHDMLA